MLSVVDIGADDRREDEDRSAATIGLAMIVRDESAVIERCLHSLLPLIETWTICDTGSSDGTPELIAATLGHLPGELHHRPWRDFGTNRSELMELARGSADYLLLIDADQTLEIREPLGTRGPLDADSYLLRHAGDLSYLIPRLVSGTLPWRFLGATHEYLDCPEPFSQEILEALVVHHHADGGRREDKFERDARLLERELQSDPGNARSTFYLAQTMRDLGEEPRAIELYQRRVELGGWDEEVFYAAYQAGVLIGHDDPAAGCEALERAHAMRPSRAEPLLEIARLQRLVRDYEGALETARRGLAIPEPEDRLFVHREAYRWGLLFELSICCYWTGHHEEALLACDRLLVTEGLPTSVRAAVSDNRGFSLGRLPDRRSRRSAEGWGEELANLAPSCLLAGIDLDIEPDWPRFNPSITAEGDGFALIVRTANYRLEDGRYRFLDDNDRIRTLNYLVTLDGESLAVRDVEPLRDVGAGPPRDPAAAVIGFEDLRLIVIDGLRYATATVRDRSPDAVCRIALLSIEGTEITDVRLLEGPEPGRHEKNWMPFELNGGLGLVYSLEPTRVFACDPARGDLATIARDRSHAYPGELRGGSQGIRTPEGLLFAVHEVSALGNSRLYSHRLALLDDELRLTAVSPRFRFTDQPIEVCLGLARAPGGKLVMSFGAADRHAGLALCDESELLDLLEPVAGGLVPA